MSLPAVTALNEVQRERMLSLETVSQPDVGTTELTEQQQRTDAALQRLNSEAAPVMESAPQELQEPMGRLNGYFDGLADLRSRIDSGAATPDELNSQFNDLFDTATEVFDVQARITPEAETLEGAITATSLFRASDMFARESSLVTVALGSGELTPAQHRELTGYITTHHDLLETNERNLEPEVAQQYRELVGSPEWQRLTAVEDALVAGGPFTGTEQAPVRADEWRDLSTSVGDRASELARNQADIVSARGAANGDNALWTVVWGSLAALVVAVLSFAFARRVYRTVVDEALITRLQGLRTESLDMARRLPEVVERLRDGKSVDVENELVSMRNYGNDEVGQVAHAIRLFQTEAVEAAVGETRARQGARVVFVGMAHRIQRLLRTMHGTIDTLENNEENSAQLAKLYDLDNSTTRARRTVENLLVLGDQQPGRRWSRSVPLMDVVRSSVSEIDQYSRVVIGHIPDVLVNGAAVGDTIHLIAELIDNATAFSPPHTQVHVTATAVARGVAIEIADQGLGMDESVRERANRMMNEPPEFDRLVLENNKAEQLGLFTAARLASRRDVAVEFGVSAYGGTRATVLVPDRILEEPEHRVAEHETRPAATVPAPRELSWNGVMTDQPETAVSPATAEPPTWEWPVLEPNRPEPERSAEPPADDADRGSAPESAQQSDSGGEAGSGGRPPLPKRVPQSNLAEGLKDDPDNEEEVVATPSRLAGFRRAFRGGSGPDQEGERS
nr:nitrate- and nitrite sensing domain-containing protein [Saccharopolyspora sp. HNM0983]